MTVELAPVTRWTPAEAWLMAEVARRSLVASLDGAAPVTGSCSPGMGPWPCARSLATLDGLGVRRPRIDEAIIAGHVKSLIGRGLIVAGTKGQGAC